MKEVVRECVKDRNRVKHGTWEREKWERDTIRKKEIDRDRETEGDNINKRERDNIKDRI